MFERNSGFRLFNIFGFQVSADWSWLIIAVLLSWSLATGYYPAALGHEASASFLGLGVLSALLMFFSVVLHEVGHSYVARQYGIRILGIRLFIFGGVAQMDREPRSPAVEIKVALAGPAVSAMLAFVFFVFSQLPITTFAAVSLFLARVNLTMVLFNMIPGFPMDGGRVLRALVWRAKNDYYAATKIATDIGRYVAFGFMGLGGLMILGGGFGNGLWLILIGIFLHQAAKSNQIFAEYSRWQSSQYDRASAYDPIVDINMPIQHVIDAFLRDNRFAEFPVFSEGRFVGSIDAGAVNRVPWLLRRFVRVGEIMRPVRQHTVFDPFASFFDHTAPIEFGDNIRYKIFDRDGRIVGMRL